MNLTDLDIESNPLVCPPRSIQDLSRIQIYLKNLSDNDYDRMVKRYLCIKFIIFYIL